MAYHLTTATKVNCTQRMENGIPLVILCYVQEQPIMGHDTFIMLSNNTIVDANVDIFHHAKASKEMGTVSLRRLKSTPYHYMDAPSVQLGEVTSPPQEALDFYLSQLAMYSAFEARAQHLQHTGKRLRCPRKRSHKKALGFQGTKKPSLAANETPHSCLRYSCKAYSTERRPINKMKKPWTWPSLTALAWANMLLEHSSGTQSHIWDAQRAHRVISKLCRRKQCVPPWRTEHLEYSSNSKRIHTLLNCSINNPFRTEPPGRGTTLPLHHTSIHQLSGGWHRRPINPGALGVIGNRARITIGRLSGHLVSRLICGPVLGQAPSSRHHQWPYSPRHCHPATIPWKILSRSGSTAARRPRYFHAYTGQFAGWARLISYLGPFCHESLTAMGKRCLNALKFRTRTCSCFTSLTSSIHQLLSTALCGGSTTGSVTI